MLSRSFKNSNTLKNVSTIQKSFYHYQPMIKFVYSRDSPLEIIDTKAKDSNIHPCSGSINLFPSSDECLSVKDWQSKFYKPFLVQKYTPKPKKATPSPNKATSKQFVSKTNSANFNRPLKENELESLSSLPKQFKHRPIEESEMDLINGGGVMI